MHDLFVPNDSEQAIWLTCASDGKRWKLPVSQHLSINFTQSSAIAVARENVPDCVPAKSAWVLTGGTDRYSARTAMGSERPHTAESACRFLGVHHPTVDQAEPGRPMDAPAYEITSPALSSKDAGPINRL